MNRDNSRSFAKNAAAEACLFICARWVTRSPQDIYDRIDRMDPATFEVRATEILMGLGFSTVRRRPPRQVSQRSCSPLRRRGGGISFRNV